MNNANNQQDFDTSRESELPLPMRIIGQGGCFGFGMILLLVIVGFFLIIAGLLVLNVLWGLFSITPAGQAVTVALTFVGLALGFMRWTDRQVRSVSGIIGMAIIFAGIGIFAWLVIQSGFFSEERLDIMQDRATTNPVAYFASIVFLLTSLAGGIAYIRRFVRGAYSSKLSLVFAVLRLAIMIVIVIFIIRFGLASKVIDVSKVRDAMLTPQAATPQGFQ